MFHSQELQHWWIMLNSRHRCAEKAPLELTDVVHLALKVDEHMGNPRESHSIGNYQLQGEKSSVKLSCLHLGRALEYKLSGAAYYMDIMPNKQTQSIYMRPTMDYFQ